jgi:hypothetical protein
LTQQPPLFAERYGPRRPPRIRALRGRGCDSTHRRILGGLTTFGPGLRGWARVYQVLYSFTCDDRRGRLRGMLANAASSISFDVACSRKLKPDFRRNWPAACAKVRDGGPVSGEPSG